MHVGMVAKSDIDQALDLATELEREGVQITLYLSLPHLIRELETSENPIEKLYELELIPRTIRVRLFDLPRMRDPRSLPAVYRIYQEMLKDGLDVVHVLSGPHELWLAILALLIRGLPVVSTMIVPVQNVGEFPSQRIVWWINKILAMGSKIIIVNGENQVEQAHRLYRLPYERIVHVRLGARRTTMKFRRHQVEEQDGTILFFGRLAAFKGLKYLISAQPAVSQKFPEARFLIVGHDEDMPAYFANVEDMDRFEIHEEYVTGDMAAAFFDRSSLVVLPYLSASTSGVLLMAHCFKKPVVATRVGCLPEYVEDGRTGILVDPQNVEQLAEAIGKMLEDGNRRRAMGQAGYDSVMAREGEIVQKTLAVYNRVTGKS